ncbi:MAG: SDR family oxidoreductase [Geodermatophilaceae bacterium]|nr:SDR family oxidoreductase [Geodermatophilaceae bacterium]MDQ3464314.1 SDR family oxidoreductase [Actinomycetota bacterium]
MQGRAALVTGGSRGIGLAIAQELVRRGARVTVTARKPEELAAAVEALGGDEHALAVSGNAGDPEHRTDAVARTLERFGRLDMLVNNVGINPIYGPLVEADLGAVRKIMDVNYVAALGFVQEAHRDWLGGHGGSVLFIASVAGLRCAEGIGAYGSSKAALFHLAMQLAVELGPGVRVNALAPAVVKTKFATALYEGREAAVADAYPLKRLGVPEDVARAAAFLLSDEASWVTGQTLVLDGGVMSRGQL